MMWRTMLGSHHTYRHGIAAVQKNLYVQLIIAKMTLCVLRWRSGNETLLRDHKGFSDRLNAYAVWIYAVSPLRVVL